MKISATVITYNESANIARCLKSLDFCDEIVVVDSLSQDDTLKIAKSLGAKVYSQRFLGYIAQKQLAVEKASYDWILSLDADEEISSELRASILELKQKEPSADAYLMHRISFHLGRWIRHGGWYPDKKVRLFNRKKARWGGYNPHDKVIVQGSIGKLKGDIKHYVFRDLRHNVDTNNAYSTIMAEDLYKQGERFKLTKLLLKPIGKFFEVYIYKRGFLDGMAGFIIAVGASYSMFLKFAKLWELEKIKKQQSL